MPTDSSSPEATPRLRRALVLFFRVVLSGVLAVAVFLFAFLIGAKTAAAHWLAAGSGSTTATVATLLAPTNVVVPSSSNSNVAVSWTGSAGTVAPTGYYVTRLTGSTVVPACGSSIAVPITATACTDTSVPEGTHKYQVTAVHRSWTATSGVSGSVTVSSLSILRFISQPLASIQAGSALPGLTVQAQRLGDLLPELLGGVRITLSIAANPDGGTLSGTTTATTDPITGIATFTGISIDKAGVGYTLAASSPGFAGTASNGFSVIPAAATRLVVTDGAYLSGPASLSALLGPATLQRQDSFGNPVTAGTSAVSLATNSTGTTLFAATAGGAKVSTVTIEPGSSSASFFYGDTKAGTATITAASPGLTSPSPVTAAITAAAADKLQFEAIAAVVPKNINITPAVTVRVTDTFGNPAGSTSQVTVHSTSCTVKGILSVAAHAGIASFPDLQIAGNASNCRLTATSGILTADSSTFNAD